MKVIFASATKIGESATKILKLLFFTINLHCQMKSISTSRKLNLSLTSSIHFVFLPLEMQKWLEQAKVYHSFSYFVRKETTHKPLKVAAAKTLFSNVYVYWYNLLRWMFFILCDAGLRDSWKTLPFVKVYRYSETF